MSLLTNYLKRIREIRGMGMATNETSYYTPLENLLYQIGSNLLPRITVTSQLSSRSAALIPRTSGTRSMPDFGFFREENQDLRGLVEAKGADEDVFRIAERPQIAKYLQVVPAVIITNYRDFLLVTRDSSGSVFHGPSYSLASSADAFWNTPIAALAKEHEQGLRDYLENVLQHSSPIISADELAFVLARYAAEARKRIEAQPAATLDPLRNAMTQALGISFPGEKGEAFFRSSLVQTLFYGLFSAWILWAERERSLNAEFEWESASNYLNVSVVGALFEAIATNRKLRSLNLADTVRWAEDALNRVDRQAFFSRFDQDHAIQYFYEPFLEAYDPELKEQLGVWYTPPEIVRYQIKKIDQLLQDELGLADGLADESVILLDPCTGTGSYILEAARVINERLKEDEPNLAAARTKIAVQTRLFGFEIMPAPFVIAHLQMGRFTASCGSELAEDERAPIYLTNALTNWSTPGVPQQSTFPELAAEREAAERVKREEKILVIVGNPPYWRYATMAIGEEAELIAPYKEGLYRRFRVRKTTIDDLYIRFYRLAEWRIAEQETHRGIVSFISNWSWLAGSSFPVMREHLIQNFDTIRIDNLGGAIRGRDRSIGESDESVFLTEWSPGIKLGVAISFLTVNGNGEKNQEASVFYRRILGTAENKRAALMHSIEDSDTTIPYTQLAPTIERKWVLRPAGEAGAYDNWTSLDRLLPFRESGVNENRGGSLISIDREPLEALQTAYTNKRISHDKFAHKSERSALLMSKYARYDAEKVRTALNQGNHPEPLRIMRFAWKAMDDRWLLWGEEKLLNEKRKDLLALVDSEDVRPANRNVFLVTSENARVVFAPPGVTSYIGDLHYQDPWAQLFPLRFRTNGRGFIQSITRPNLDDQILQSLCQSWSVSQTSEPRANATDEELAVGEAVFYHVLATMHTPAYRETNMDALTNNWAHIPIPTSRELLLNSAELGRRLAELLRTDLAPAGVVKGAPTWLKRIAQPARVDGHQLRDPDDFRVTVNYRGSGNVLKRPFTSQETEGSIFEATEETNNVFLNADAFWSNVPDEVWEYQIGGFPVLRKWLEDRKFGKLGRPLLLDEVRNFGNMARRIAAIIALDTDLDECHESIVSSELIP